MERTLEELTERQRVHDLVLNAMDQEAWKIADLMISKRDDQLFGETEFTLRDLVLRAGAQVIEATVDDRKKRGTKAVVPPAQPVVKTRVSSNGGVARS